MLPAVLPEFPNPVDETTTRIVAGEVLALNLAALATGVAWPYPLLAADFATRAAVGPRYSPLARAAAELRPRLGLPPRPTAGPPKRFAAAIGAVLTGAATGFALTGRRKPLYAVGAVMVVFPALEALAGVCVGCHLFGLLMRAGLVPEEVCAECADVSQRLQERAAALDAAEPTAPGERGDIVA